MLVHDPSLTCFLRARTVSNLILSTPYSPLASGRVPNTSAPYEGKLAILGSTFALHRGHRHDDSFTL